MKLGFMQIYNEVDWVGFAIDQAIILCDKLLIVEGSQFVDFTDIPERSDDGTLDIISDKAKQYSKQIILFNTTRKHKNYRHNQCDNFNRGLGFCDIDDYFLKLDADDFFTDEWIIEANELMAENKIDLISVRSYNFAFGFKWHLGFNRKEIPRAIAIRKIEGLHFVPTSKHKGVGKNQIVSSGISRFHYMWVKPKARMLVRIQTSGRYPNMVNWLNENWDNFELKDGGLYPGYSGEFTLHKYGGRHPSILDNHPWRNIDDIRRL